MGMIAKRLNTTIRNYAPHYYLARNATMETKTVHLSRNKVWVLYFLYEEKHFGFYWEVFVKNGSNLITTAVPTTTSTTTTVLTTTSTTTTSTSTTSTSSLLSPTKD